MTGRRFRDRRDAGRQLADRVARVALVDPFVLALPRGGVPVGFEVARALDAPLDVFVARKLGAPTRPELGIGAIAEGGASVIDRALARAVGAGDADIAALGEREQAELERRVAQYRGGRSLPSFVGRDVVLVDDGLATGVTAVAALRALRRGNPRRLVLAAPVGAAEATAWLAEEADHVVCVTTAHQLGAIGFWYDDFAPTTDDEVLALLAERGRPEGGSSLSCL